VAKYDVVQVVTVGKGWWRVQKDERVGYVPARHLRLLARHEEHLYHGGMVWSGPARRKQALELREEELQAERVAEVGFGRIVALHYWSATLYQIHSEIRYLFL
jgi:hypothetical protein